jgi:cell division inhibitor SulA/protein ImuA
MSLDDLIAQSKLWRGRGAVSSAAVLPTGFDALDRYLPGGGWPQRALTEIFLDRYGIGELSLLMPALAELSRQTAKKKPWIVWIAPPFIPYAPALSRHGLDLERVLLVHPSRAPAARSGSAGTLAAAVTSQSPKDALWAVEQTIRSKASTAALAWLDEASSIALRRLQLGAEQYRCWTVLFQPAAALSRSSPAALRLRLSHRGGYARIEILKCRGRRPSTFEIELPVLRNERVMGRGALG